MQFADFRAQRLPIAGGITEAACKTIFTQRLKLSGMRWRPATGQHIVDLRTAVIWRKLSFGTQSANGSR
jgi:hypothetical protein